MERNDISPLFTEEISRLVDGQGAKLLKSDESGFLVVIEKGEDSKNNLVKPDCNRTR